MSAGIYAITNIITNDVYIGYSNQLKRRYNDYKSLSVRAQPLIYKSLLDYGFSNHKFEVIHDVQNPTTRELKKLEIFYILHYKNHLKRNLLNSNRGGGGSSKWSDDLKLRQGLLRQDTKLSKNILQYGFDGVFIKRWNSIRLASKELNLDYNLLIKCCKLINKSVGGFQWRYDKDQNKSHVFKKCDLNKNFLEELTSYQIRVEKGYNVDLILRKIKTNGFAYGFYWKLSDEEIISKIPENIESYSINRNSSGRSILQYDLEGNFIKEWNSTSEAAKYLNIPINEIFTNSHLIELKYNKKNRKQSYQWRFKIGNEYDRKITPFCSPKVIQYDLHGNFIREWETTTEIENSVGLRKKTINGALCGRVKTAYKFQWKYSRNGTIPSIPSIIKTKEEKFKINLSEINQYGLDGIFIKSYPYPKIAENDLNIAAGSIANCAKGKLKTAGKFQWRYKFDNIDSLAPIKMISQYDLNNNLIKEWNSQTQIFKELSLSKSQINRCLRGKRANFGGFMWKYKKM